MQGDALSTACFILGPEKGMALAATYGVQALFILEDGQLVLSEGMERYWSESEQ
jgi:thiamine biosynthesis lipoprotein